MTDADRTQRRFSHPGSGRRKGGARPKGRQTDPNAVEELRAALFPATVPTYRRDRLIEYLHVIQDRWGQLSARHLAALADEIRLAMAEVYEVATFYAHFDLVKEDETPPPPLTVRVCESLSCAMAGAAELLAALPTVLGREVRVVPAPCVGGCDRAPVAVVGRNPIDRADVATVQAAVAVGATEPALPPYRSLAPYRAAGGYAALTACRSGEMTIEQVMDDLAASGLRGKGGAGFPASRKWSFVRAEAGPRHVAINGDEGEPGTFKDRFYLESDPHRCLEGALIAAWGVEAEAVHIYLRDEYAAARHILAAEVAALEDAGLAAPGYIDLRRGAGAYICGEESAMLESIEGKRGLPRHRPPFVAQKGLFGRPTLVHNVETVSWLPTILTEGPAAFGGHGRRGRKGLHSFSVSGRVKQPGVKLAPAGISVRELIEEYCGGMAEGHTFRAYLPGGASGGILPASLGDLPLDFDTLAEHGCFIGSAAVIVLSDRDDLAAAALNLMRFFEEESCGQCTPCRVGTGKAARLMQQPEWDVPLLTELSRAMADASICGLGQAAPNPLLSLLRHFPEAVPSGPELRTAPAGGSQP